MKARKVYYCWFYIWLGDQIASISMSVIWRVLAYTKFSKVCVLIWERTLTRIKEFVWVACQLVGFNLLLWNQIWLIKRWLKSSSIISDFYWATKIIKEHTWKSEEVFITLINWNHNNQVIRPYLNPLVIKWYQSSEHWA